MTDMQPVRPHAPVTCGAKTRDGDPCKNPPVHGSKRCRMHGGKTPKGIASPLWNAGRTNRYLPARLLERVKEALDDPALLSLRNEIAVLDARMTELYGRIDQGGATENWTEARRLMRAFQRARDANPRDAAGMVEHFGKLEALILDQAHEGSVWWELRQLWDDRRRLVESERKRRVEEGHMLPREQVLAFYTQLGAAVAEEVSSPEERQRVTNRMMSLLMIQGGTADS